jgi:hypothetical protein
MELRLRGHHLLCLLGYQGMVGYSADFTANMTKVHQTLQEQPESLVTLIEALTICAHAILLMQKTIIALINRLYSEMNKILPKDFR